ncbi:MAG: hypothetical protein M3217_09060, partial [Actinomycetota bacterium]|nr:hypothetical protein [Actinomycetota bacterium]
MSLRSWWEERKRLQEEREARRYALEEDADDTVWVDPDDPETDRDAGDATEADRVASEPVAEDDRETPAAYEESWWKRRLLGGPRHDEPGPDEEPAVAEERELGEPPPAAEPEPEPVDEKPPAAEERAPDEPPPAAEPEPEPVDEKPPAAEDPEPEAEPPYEEVLEEELTMTSAFDEVMEDPVAEVVYEEPGPGERPYSYPDEDELFDEEPVIRPDVDVATAATPVGADVPGPRRARLEG